MNESFANKKRRPRPIVLIGAGGIARDAHLPAYRLARFPVAGLYDADPARARALAARFGVPRVYGSLAEAVGEAPAGAVFDLAVPASVLPRIVSALPAGASALLQKPFGETLAQSRALLRLCRRKRLKAAVNFQLRFAPYIVAARRLIDAGAIGRLHDLEVRVTVHTPWKLWPFMEGIPRAEILYHSIHYIDLIRSFFGEPRGIYAKTLPHPLSPKLTSARTAIALDYGRDLRANLTANHGHDFGPRHQESYVKWEGTRGAIVARMGLLLDYPRGRPDALELWRKGAWRKVPFRGSWFPHAFIGTMASVMRHADGGPPPPTRVEDAFKTMAVVEAAYRSSARGATPIPQR